MFLAPDSLLNVTLTEEIIKGRKLPPLPLMAEWSLNEQAVLLLLLTPAHRHCSLEVQGYLDSLSRPAPHRPNWDLPDVIFFFFAIFVNQHRAATVQTEQAGIISL